MSSGQILQPNQLAISLNHDLGCPLAHPVVTTAKTPTGLSIVVQGGMTRRQEIAKCILAGLATNTPLDCEDAVGKALKLADELIERTEGEGVQT